MDNRLTIGTVHVLEWLRPGDQKTGQDLVDVLQPLAISSTPRVEVRYWHAATRDDVLTALLAIAKHVQTTRRIPLLQIETHGATDGIGFDDQQLSWPELMKALIPLNRLTGVRLVVILAACEGFWGTQMLPLDRRAAAFRGLIGPNRKIDWPELLAGCMAFYRTVFGQIDGNAAMRAMNDAVDPNEETFWHIGAETVFKLTYQGHLETQGTPEAVERRVEKIVENNGARVRAAGRGGRFKWEIEALRERVRRKISDHRALFEGLRRDFSFIELYPENNDRFDIRFEDCEPRQKVEGRGD